METKVENKIVYTLILNEEEATWLHGVMQNPLYNQTPSEESSVDATMREKFFGATLPVRR